MATLTSRELLANHVHDLPARRRQVAAIWSLDDVQELRPDVNDNHAWDVLRECRKLHDCKLGFSWLLIQAVANDLNPRPSNDQARPAHL